MNVVLTICSANYFAHARVLGDSLLETNPGCRFVVGLVDRLPAGFDRGSWQPFEVIPVEQIGIRDFEQLAWKYNVVELNTAAKPFYLDFLYRRDPKVESVTYLDPDILVLGSFAPLFSRLRESSLVLTPHSCTYDDSPFNLRYEMSMLGTGIYNLGFIATSKTGTTSAFLRWWQNRVRDHCYYRPGSGVFVDQLWVALAPLYFPGVFVEKNPGYNMCYWNHFERRLSVRDGAYVVNGEHPLVFYHFSSYDPANPGRISSRPNDPTASFAERPDLRPLFDDYRSRLLAAGYNDLKSVRYAFNQRQEAENASLKGRVKRCARRLLQAIPGTVRRPIHRLAHFTALNSGG